MRSVIEVCMDICGQHGAVTECVWMQYKGWGLLGRIAHRDTHLKMMDRKRHMHHGAMGKERKHTNVSHIILGH